MSILAGRRHDARIPLAAAGIGCPEPLNDLSPEPNHAVETGPPEAEAGGGAHDRPRRARRELAALQARAGGAECAAVVKADGYGLGLSGVARALGRAGCRSFFVADLSEAVAAREACGDGTVHVLNGLLPGTAATYAGLGLTPILGSQDEVAEWAGFCRNAGARYPAALHFDTGMNRLGLPAADAAEVARSPPPRRFRAGPADEPFRLRRGAGQPAERAPDRTLRGGARKRSPTCGPRSATRRGLPARKAHYDLVRPGYALYGGNPTPGRSNPMQAVIRLKARIVQIRGRADGDTVGYNAQWTAQRRDGGLRRCRSATPTATRARRAPPTRSATRRRERGHRCRAALPLAGRVSMDLIIVDVTEVPDGAVGAAIS